MATMAMDSVTVMQPRQKTRWQRNGNSNSNDGDDGDDSDNDGNGDSDKDNGNGDGWRDSNGQRTSNTTAMVAMGCTTVHSW